MPNSIKNFLENNFFTCFYCLRYSLLSLAKYHKRVIKSISYGGAIFFTQELSQENVFYSMSVENNNNTLFYPNNIFRGQIKIQIYRFPFNTQVY